MKFLLLVFVVSMFGSNLSMAADKTVDYQRLVLGDALLQQVTNDEDNGDGVADGALKVSGQSDAVGQGVTFSLQDAMTVGQNLNVSTNVYSTNGSFVRFRVELVNAKRDQVLAKEQVVFQSFDDKAIEIVLTHTVTDSDAGDPLLLRYIRTDDGDTKRAFAIDNIVFNEHTVPLYIPCFAFMTPDLELPSADASVESEIDQIIQRFSDDFLDIAPTQSELDSAVVKYDKLKISNDAGSVTAKGTVKDFSKLNFVRTFARQLKFNPSDTETKEKLNNVVTLAGSMVCKGDLALKSGSGTYVFRTFARAVSLSPEHLDASAKGLFEYLVFRASNNYEHFWAPVYDTAYQAEHGAINTDHIYTLSGVMLAMAQWQPTSEQTRQYMQGFQRYYERFNSHSMGTTNGIKPDGAGFHHWTGYLSYMYAYKSAANILWYLRDTKFQISESSYRVFRDALYHHLVQSNDLGLYALSASGRNPHNRIKKVDAQTLKRTALAGGSILGVGNADVFLAKLYTRIEGVDSEFGALAPLDFDEGFTQLNHASTGVYRKANWVAVNKGFTAGLWGTEIYKKDNRFGRYQSYGALEILYPGSGLQNGFNVDTWDWNMNPGATVIRLPWDELHAERERIDEYQGKQFVGALAFNQSEEDKPLQHVSGSSGVFAMDFQGVEPVKSFGTVYSESNNHNDSFTFKKSSFYFDDMIVNLASNISNNDAINPTVTTLYQRIDNTINKLSVNDADVIMSEEKRVLSGANNNWVVNHYGTGFLVVSGDHNVELTHGSQQTPNHYQTVLDDVSGNASDVYHIGYINHGAAPSNKGYEYIIKPNTSTFAMRTLAGNMNNGEKPYTVHRRDGVAHVVEHVLDKRWGYSVFEANDNVSEALLKSTDTPSLIMHQYDDSTNELRLSIASPDLGLGVRSQSPTVSQSAVVELRGEWDLVDDNERAEVVSKTSDATRVEFKLIDGLPVEIVLKKMSSVSVSVTALTINEDSNVTVSGESSPGATVNVTFPSGAVETVSVDASGVFSVTSKTPQPSSGSVSVVASDASRIASAPIQQSYPVRTARSSNNGFFGGGVSAWFVLFGILVLGMRQLVIVARRFEDGAQYS